MQTKLLGVQAESMQQMDAIARRDRASPRELERGCFQGDGDPGSDWIESGEICRYAPCWRGHSAKSGAGPARADGAGRNIVARHQKRSTRGG